MQRITRRNQKYRTEEEKPVEQPKEEQKEKVKDTNIFSFGISFVKRLNLNEIQREYKRNKRLGKYEQIFE